MPRRDQQRPQARFFAELPAHLERIALFKLRRIYHLSRYRTVFEELMAGVLPATLRVALRSKIAPGNFVMAGVLPATLRVPLRSKIVLCSASCLAKNPASAIHGYGVRR